MFLFADDMMLYIYLKKKKRFYQKTHRTDKFRKVRRYKISIQKSVSFLCMNNELAEKEIKVIPFIIAMKKNLGIN